MAGPTICCIEPSARNHRNAVVHRPQLSPGAAGRASQHESVAAASRLPLDELLQRVQAEAQDWERITLQLPNEHATNVHFTIDRGTGGQPQLRDSLVLDGATGRVSAAEPFSGQSAGRQARLWVRFLHTGEAFGWLGQAIAGAVSLLSLLMVWTGLALAWRRLILPLLRRRGAA